MESTPGWEWGRQYAGIVKEKYLLRQAIALSNEMLTRSYGPQDDDGATAILLESQAKIARMVQDGADDGFRDIGRVVSDARSKMSATGNADLVPFGIPLLDQELWRRDARRAMRHWGEAVDGEVGSGRAIAMGAARAGNPVAFISLEESPDKIGRNVLTPKRWSKTTGYAAWGCWTNMIGPRSDWRLIASRAFRYS